MFLVKGQNIIKERGRAETRVKKERKKRGWGGKALWGGKKRNYDHKECPTCYYVTQE